MKTVLKNSLILLLITFSLSCNSQSTKSQTANDFNGDIEVYYFHFTRRCVTCNMVESETKKALEQLYPKQMSNGTIKFLSINLDEKEGKETAKKLSVGGQALIITNGKSKFDLTDKGFMYARSNQQKFYDEIKNTVDPLIADK